MGQPAVRGKPCETEKFSFITSKKVDVKSYTFVQKNINNWIP